jgi:hypothetical protein
MMWAGEGAVDAAAVDLALERHHALRQPLPMPGVALTLQRRRPRRRLRLRRPSWRAVKHQRQPSQ